MNILAIDTATTPHSISLHKKDETVSIVALDASTQSEHMFLEINAILQKAQIDYKNLDAILCTVGPGSFTGIRIGIAAIRGIKKILPHIKIYGFTTLELIAYSKNKDLKKSNVINVIMNAFGNEFYVQTFDAKNNQLSNIQVIHKETLSKNMNDQIFISNDKSLVSTSKDKIVLAEYDATTIINYYFQYPEKARDVKPLYIKKPNIHHGALRKNT